MMEERERINEGTFEEGWICDNQLLWEIKLPHRGCRVVYYIYSYMYSYIYFICILPPSGFEGWSWNENLRTQIAKSSKCTFENSNEPVIIIYPFS